MRKVKLFLRSTGTVKAVQSGYAQASATGHYTRLILTLVDLFCIVQAAATETSDVEQFTVLQNVLYQLNHTILHLVVLKCYLNTH